MSRKPRIHFKGALYHVICRGNNREHIFKTNIDKQDYLLQIIRYKKRYKFKLYSYCIMDNHAHLVIEVAEDPLSKIMQGVQQVYTLRYNARNDRVGHVFQQRYKAVLIDKQSYLLQLIKYIHKNPVEAHYDEGLNYLWSSHNEYVKNTESPIADIKYPLAMFSKFKNLQVSNYLKFMSINEDNDFNQYKDYELAPLEYRSHFDNSKNDKVLYKPETIVFKISNVTGITLSQIRAKTRKQSIVDARKLMVYMLSDHTYLSRKEIAHFVNLSPSSVSIMLNNKEIFNSFEQTNS